ncbi:hypothetical protein [Natronomonas salsuginis]|uniref:Uncharacterized protein n=1 Tax=Natronomonas salsuginis TaxID=2217661 RepID=A0A4U5JFI5_9EURY|nr:hypothetical protein [Natronomonas salsuginis]TKR27954.1 hypothetical protein DM868_02405 [Natronomonas salsuginis]
MTRVTNIDHEPLDSGRGNVCITLNDDTHIDLTATENETRIARTEGMLSTNRVTDPAVIEQHLDDITDQLPDDVERTARRILQVDAWIREKDPTRAADISIPIHGRYRPLRDQTLVLIEETTEYKGNRALPIIVPFNEDISDGKQLQRRLNDIMERVTMRAMGAQQESAFRDDLTRQAVAVKWRVVESLDDAEKIVHGEPQSAKAALTSY